MSTFFYKSGSKIYNRSFISTSRASATILRVIRDMFTLPFSKRCINWLSRLFIKAANPACVNFLFCRSSLILFPTEIRSSLFLSASSLSSFFIFGSANMKYYKNYLYN